MKQVVGFVESRDRRGRRPKRGCASGREGDENSQRGFEFFGSDL